MEGGHNSQPLLVFLCHVVLEEGVVKIKDDDLFPFPKLRVDVIDCGHGGRYVLDVLVDGIEVDDQSAIVFC